MDRRPGQEARIGSFKSGWVWKRQLAWLFLKKWVKWKSLSHVRLSVTPWTVYSPWNSPGQNTGVGSLSLLQEIFPTQGLNPGLLHCRQILYQLSHRGSPLALVYEYNSRKDLSSVQYWHWKPSSGINAQFRYGQETLMLLKVIGCKRKRKTKLEKYFLNTKRVIELLLFFLIEYRIIVFSIEYRIYYMCLPTP